MTNQGPTTNTVDAMRRPARLRWVIWAVLSWCVCTVLAAVAMFGQRSYLADALVKNNAKAKAPKPNYVGHIVDTDVSNVLRYGIIQSVLISVILAMVTFAVLRGRAWARWLLLAFATVLGVVLPVFGIGVVVQLLTGLLSSFPVVYRILELLAGLSAAAVIAILFLPEVRAYFSGVRVGEKAQRRAGGAAPVGSTSGARPVSPLGLLLGRRAVQRGSAPTLAADGAPASPVVAESSVSVVKPGVAAANPGVPMAQQGVSMAETAVPAAKRARRAAPKSREQ